MAGVAADLGHVSTPTAVSSYACPEDIGKALDGADIVLIPSCSIPRHTATEVEQFKLNAGMVKSLATEVARHSPKAHLCIISNSINYTVPIAAEMLKKAGAYDEQRLFGVTTEDIARAKVFAADARGLNPLDVDVNVVGGHCDATIVPLLSQTGLNFSPEEAKALTERIQQGIARTYDTAGALSMAHAGSEFCGSLLRAIRGERGVSECSYVQSTLAGPKVPYFSSRVELGRNGICHVKPIGRLSPYEEELKAAACRRLQQQIEEGIRFASM